MSHSSGTSTPSSTSTWSQDTWDSDPSGNNLREEGEIEEDVEVTVSPPEVPTIEIKVAGPSTNNNRVPNGHEKSKYGMSSAGIIPGQCKWIYTNEQLSNTPSVVRGMTYTDEGMLRRIGIQLITRIHNELNGDYKFRVKDLACPPARVVASASVFFHRFYMYHPFQIFHPLELGITCYYLACKTEEKPRPGTDIIMAARQLLQNFKTKTGSFFDTDCTVADIQREIWTLENILLQTINFEIIVEHPFTRHIEKCLLCFKRSSAEVITKLRKRINFFLEESLTSSISLQWPARPVAISLVLLACNKERVPVREWDTLRCESEFYEFENFRLLRETVKKVGDVISSTVIESKTQVADPRICTAILERSFSNVEPKSSEKDSEMDVDNSDFLEALPTAQINAKIS